MLNGGNNTALTKRVMIQKDSLLKYEYGIMTMFSNWKKIDDRKPEKQINGSSGVNVGTDK